MNGNVHKPVGESTSTGVAIPNSTSVPNIAKLSTLSPTQQQRYRQDWLERENQASSLAAAGMVAESVVRNGTTESQHLSSSINNNNTTPNYVTTTIPVLGLQPPPTIFAQQPTLPGGVNHDTTNTTTSTNVTELDSINWNLMDIGGMHIDDMDMDFATLFDPANEMSGMVPSLSSQLDVNHNTTSTMDIVTTTTTTTTNGWLPPAPTLSTSIYELDMNSISPTPLSSQQWSESILTGEEKTESPIR
jgi:hypothetical protein